MEIRKLPFADKRALVLGGGGASGNAWLIGVIAGLFDTGVDVTQADLIIGTSAGSTTAAQITSATPSDLLANILAATPQPKAVTAGSDREPVTIKPMTNHMEAIRAIIASAEDAADMRRKMGAWAMEKDATLGSSFQTQWRTTVAARLPSQAWPQQQMLITAVDAHTGEPVVFDRNSGVDLVDAVAASTAGGFAYTIGDTRYIDGGYGADANINLADGYGLVLVIPPLGDKTLKPLAWGLHFAAQVAELRAHGSNLQTILPDEDSQNAMGAGMNVLDLSTRRPSAEAGYNQGKFLAGQLSEFWS